MTTNLNETFAAVQVASRELALLNDDVINQILNAVADAAIAETPFILSENEKDLARMDKNDPKYDRLKTDGRTFERYCRRYTQCSNTPLSFG